MARKPPKKSKAPPVKQRRRKPSKAEQLRTALDTAVPDHEPNPVGRPSKFKPEFIKQAKKLCQLGATDRELADFFGVAESTLHLWKLEHPEFSESLKAGKDVADDRVERSLYQRACGYSHPDVHITSYEGDVTITPIIKHYPPDATSGIFWLKNRRKEDWRDKIDHSHTGIPKSAPATIIIGGKQR